MTEITINLDTIADDIKKYGHPDTALYHVLSRFMVEKICTKEMPLDGWLKQIQNTDNYSHYTNPTLEGLVNKDVNVWCSALFWFENNAAERYKTLISRKGDLLAGLGNGMIVQTRELSSELLEWLNKFAHSEGMVKWIKNANKDESRKMSCLGFLNLIIALEMKGYIELANTYFEVMLDGHRKNKSNNDTVKLFWKYGRELAKVASDVGIDVADTIHKITLRRVVEASKVEPKFSDGLLKDISYSLIAESRGEKLGFSDEIVNMLCQTFKEMDISMETLRVSVDENQSTAEERQRATWRGMAKEIRFDKKLEAMISRFEAAFLKDKTGSGRIAKKSSRAL